MTRNALFIVTILTGSGLAAWGAAGQERPAQAPKPAAASLAPGLSIQPGVGGSAGGTLRLVGRDVGKLWDRCRAFMPAPGQVR